MTKKTFQKSIRKAKKAIPFRPSLFWDADVAKIHPQKHARYIIERILDFGNDKEAAWMAHQYSSRLIRDTLHTSRAIHDKSKALWSQIFH